jgi:hypothetical protein
LKNVVLQRTKDGYFVGANFPVDPKLTREETDFDVNDKARSENARRARWLELMEEYKGRIDVPAGQKFLSDHHDAYTGQVQPSERTLCGHIDLSPRGMGTWQGPFAPAGAVQNKVADAASAEKMSMTPALGHACGMHFKAHQHLARHPQFEYTREILKDMPARGWVKFAAK